MATKAQVTGVVVSDKMNKTVKVAIERQIRDPLYGKTSKRTSTFLAHDEKNEAKVGDIAINDVTITEGNSGTSIATFTVLSILSLTTTPVTVAFVAIATPSPSRAAPS